MGRCGDSIGDSSTSSIEDSRPVDGHGPARRWNRASQTEGPPTYLGQSAMQAWCYESIARCYEPDGGRRSRKTTNRSLPLLARVVLLAATAGLCEHAGRRQPRWPLGWEPAGCPLTPTLGAEPTTSRDGRPVQARRASRFVVLIFQSLLFFC